MTEVKNWTASRSGASLTVYGEDAEGKSVRIPNIRQISPHPIQKGVVVATPQKSEAVSLIV